MNANIMIGSVKVQVSDSASVEHRILTPNRQIVRNFSHSKLRYCRYGTVATIGSWWLVAQSTVLRTSRKGLAYCSMIGPVIRRVLYEYWLL